MRHRMPLSAAVRRRGSVIMLDPAALMMRRGLRLETKRCRGESPDHQRGDCYPRRDHGVTPAGMLTADPTHRRRARSGARAAV
jgi:hypothetical protein